MYSLWFITKALKCVLLVNHDDTFICLGDFELLFVEFKHSFCTFPFRNESEACFFLGGGKLEAQ